MNDNQNKNTTNTPENVSGQVSPETKSRKKSWIIGGCIAAVVVVGIGGYVWYDNYQKSITPTYTLKGDETLEYGQDPLSLIECSDCTVTDAIFKDADGNEVNDLEINTPYDVVFSLDKNGHISVVSKSITLTDTQAPVLHGVANATVEYGAEYDPMVGVSASDNVVDDANITVEGEVNTSVPGDYEITYKVSDSSGNETTASSVVTVAIPTCGDNASWDGTSCVCDSGYEGDGFTGCTAIPQRITNKQVVSSGSSQTASTSSNTSSNTTSKSQAQIDCENSWGVWRDGSWCDWSGTSDATDSSNSNGSNNGGNSWSVEIPTQSEIDAVYDLGNSIYGEGNSWGGTVVGDDIIWW